MTSDNNVGWTSIQSLELFVGARAVRLSAPSSISALARPIVGVASLDLPLSLPFGDDAVHDAIVLRSCAPMRSQFSSTVSTVPMVSLMSKKRAI
jgi:hypothetical protein